MAGEREQPAATTAAVVSGFAAVSAAETMSMSLTAPQRTKIEKLTSGHTVVDAAAAAGVNRTTLYRWLKHDPAFAAAYNAWQQDAIATARGRLLALTDVAVTAVGRAMAAKNDGGGGRDLDPLAVARGKLAMTLLERMGIADARGRGRRRRRR